MPHKFTRACQECGQDFTTPYGYKFFCTKPCQVAWTSRDIQLGFKLVALGKAWRLGRNTKDPRKKALAARAQAELCRLLDWATADDRVSRRTDALTVLQRRDVNHLIDLP